MPQGLLVRRIQGILSWKFVDQFVWEKEWMNISTTFHWIGIWVKCMKEHTLRHRSMRKDCENSLILHRSEPVRSPSSQANLWLAWRRGYGLGSLAIFRGPGFNAAQAVEIRQKVKTRISMLGNIKIQKGNIEKFSAHHSIKDDEEDAVTKWPDRVEVFIKLE